MLSYLAALCGWRVPPGSAGHDRHSLDLIHQLWPLSAVLTTALGGGCLLFPAQSTLLFVGTVKVMDTPAISMTAPVLHLGKLRLVEVKPPPCIMKSVSP